MAKEKVFKKGDPIARLVEIREMLKSESNFDGQALHDKICEAAESKGLKLAEYFSPLRLAVSGLAGGPDMVPMLDLLGGGRVSKRIDRALSELS